MNHKMILAQYLFASFLSHLEKMYQIITSYV